jgi:hypothetical protein
LSSRSEATRKIPNKPIAAPATIQIKIVSIVLSPIETHYRWDLQYSLRDFFGNRIASCCRFGELSSCR